MLGLQVFDGHNGTCAANFAEEHLLEFLLADSSYPSKPVTALVRCPHDAARKTLPRGFVDTSVFGFGGAAGVCA